MLTRICSHSGGSHCEKVRCSTQTWNGTVSLSPLTNFYGVRATLTLRSMRCLNAKTWEDRPIVLRQIDQIGEKSYVSAILSQVLTVTLHYV